METIRVRRIYVRASEDRLYQVNSIEIDAMGVRIQLMDLHTGRTFWAREPKIYENGKIEFKEESK